MGSNPAAPTILVGVRPSSAQGGASELGGEQTVAHIPESIGDPRHLLRLARFPGFRLKAGMWGMVSLLSFNIGSHPLRDRGSIFDVLPNSPWTPASAGVCV